MNSEKLEALQNKLTALIRDSETRNRYLGKMAQGGTVGGFWDDPLVTHRASRAQMDRMAAEHLRADREKWKRAAESMKGISLTRGWVDEAL